MSFDFLSTREQKDSKTGSLLWCSAGLSHCYSYQAEYRLLTHPDPAGTENCRVSGNLMNVSPICTLLFTLVWAPSRRKSSAFCRFWRGSTFGSACLSLFGNLRRLGKALRLPSRMCSRGSNTTGQKDAQSLVLTLFSRPLVVTYSISPILLVLLAHWSLKRNTSGFLYITQ